ncbi:DUF1016 N-terminal domain-containing protein [Niabella pedocola]|uniref:DUF1016 N-terminal domain-containing protein n=1 Tax=Niabella pedocola TaxID=1752077 RepID=A0ABS8PVW3_9BACT|nr:DUF1016 N-terminal domain-containing protein [Niabella pedocola]MCD2425208.1 DUF1016 N-terminal domain-containing protein [Niabella pedocola]
MAITRLYKKWLGALKEQIQRSRLQSSVTVNTNMLLHNWFLGKQIVQKSDVEGWGATEYTFSKALPAKLKNKLPTAAQLQYEVKVFYKKLKTAK